MPFLFLCLVQSKQGKYLLMGYPFLTLLVADLFRQVEPSRARRLGGLFALGLAIPTIVLVALALGAGGAKLQTQITPFLSPLRLLALVMAGGTVLVLIQMDRGRGLVPSTALSLSLLSLVDGTWGFRLLDPPKSYQRWTEVVQPLIVGVRSSIGRPSAAASWSIRTI